MEKIKKHILIVNTSFTHCGVDEYCLTLYNLLKDKFEFYFAIRKGSDFDRNVLNEEKIPEKNRLYFLNNYIKNIIVFKRFLVKNNIDIVHIHTASDYYLTLFVQKNVKLIITRHNSFKLNYIPNAIFLKRCDTIIAISNYVKNSLLDQFKFLSPKISVVYNSLSKNYDFNNSFNTNNKIKKKIIDFNNNSFNVNSNLNKTENLENTKEQDKIKLDDNEIILNNNFKKFYVGFIGRITYQKGLHILIKGFEIFLNNIGKINNEKDNNLHNDLNQIQVNNKEDIKLIVAGNFSDKKYEKYIKAMIEKAEIRKYIYFKGFVKNKSEFYKNIDFLVVPSLHIWQEAFGLIVLEAFQYKKPVITSESGALPEINIHNLTGFVYNDDNPEKLSKYIEKFYVNREQINTMGKNGYKRLKNNFSEDTFKNNMIAIYER